MGFEYDRDLLSGLSSTVARHSLKVTESPLHFRAFFSVRPHVISGHPFSRGCAEHRGQPNEESDCYSSYQRAFEEEWLNECDDEMKGMMETPSYNYANTSLLFAVQKL